jgi:hypothetical protein
MSAARAIRRGHDFGRRRNAGPQPIQGLDPKDLKINEDLTMPGKTAGTLAKAPRAAR